MENDITKQFMILFTFLTNILFGSLSCYLLTHKDPQVLELGWN